MMASTSSIKLTFLLGSNPLPVDRKLRAQFFILEESAENTYRKSSIKPPKGLFFSSTFEVRGGGLIKRGMGIKYSEKHQQEQGFSRTDLWFPGVILLFLTIRKSGWVTILNRELECEVEKVKHIKLEVMRPKTKSNMNFQPE